MSVRECIEDIIKAIEVGGKGYIFVRELKGLLANGTTVVECPLSAFTDEPP